MPLLPTTERALLHRLATAQATARTPSAVAAVVRGGETVWTAARGADPVADAGADGRTPTADTQYRVGSITKALVAVLVLRLRDEGRLALTDRLGDHLPGTQAGDATVAQLLAHSAGIPAEPRGPWWERTSGELRPDLGDLLDGGPQLHPAGHRHHYSNVGYAYLGALVAALRDAPWYEALRAEVLEPLGMRRTTLLPQEPYARGWAVHPWADVTLPEPLHDTGTMAPAGQLWSTAADMARFAAFLAGTGDDAVLAGDTLAEMRTPLIPRAFEDADLAHGLGLQVRRMPAGWGGAEDPRVLVGHGGSMPGFLATVFASPEDGLGAAFLTNVTSGDIGPVGTDLIRIVAEREPRVPAPWRPLPTADVDPELLALTGPWYLGAAPFALRLRAERALDLGPLAGTGRRSRFRPEPDGTWTGLDGYYAGETLRVVRTPDGAVSHLDLATFTFTRAPYDPATPIPGGTQGWTP